MLLLFSPVTLPKLTLSAVIDILAVAFLVYEALMIVRGTRAGHILVGILMMFALYVVAIWGRLEALHAILSYIVPYTALAVIVLFQSEIRRTLARLGRKRWLGHRFSFVRPESTDEILLALNRLSQEKIGALIVLERDIGLRTFIESGVRLEAQLSRDLLLSIFYPGGALHDGAVIVQKEHVAAAACFLPLTTNPGLSGKLGTRHRAAIGITEETDCLSLVVSEETGRISAAAFGELQSGLSVEDVDQLISVHFGVRRATLRDEKDPAADIPMAEPHVPAMPGPRELLRKEHR
ncbi:MAG TPA: diadenylate cyclase CdaA [Bryobacteraceae bacterium]|jgi:diadenylate cyclase|nr:diadenylate cyclase CdaA [Bryobacteraceae bacterium]